MSTIQWRLSVSVEEKELEVKGVVVVEADKFKLFSAASLVLKGEEDKE